MLGDYFTVISSQPALFKDPSTSHNGRQKKSPALVLRVLGCVLFFMIVFLFASPAFSADLTLGWTPNSEPDLEGYGVYFKKDVPGPPYDFYGFIILQELSDPDNPTFTMTGLQKGSRYYVALTAYDTTGNESYFSDSVCAQVGDQILPCASSDVSGGSGGGGGGGGGGCFISTISP